MQIEFLGAAHTVTGSMHLVHVNGKSILLDCGLFQGRRAEANERNRRFPFDPKSIDSVILSHAHIDHSGNLPGLVKQGYEGPIYCTSATLDLCKIMLADSGHIHEHDVEYVNKRHRERGEPPVEPLYTERDARESLELFRGVSHREWFDVADGIEAKLINAGHILGSASIVLKVRENGVTKLMGFTGDLGRKNMPIIKDPVFMGDVDLLISESTYGGIVHNPPENMAPALEQVLKKAIERRGKVIVPAFSVGRTQDIIYTLHTLFDLGRLPRIPIYVDSPLAINATEIFKHHPDRYDEETQNHVRLNHDPLGLSQLHYTRTAEESKALNNKTEPCMIISASGMCEAGRVLHHLANNIEDSRTTILIVGFQAEHTLGRKLVERRDEVRIFGDVYKRRADVVVLNSFSAHAGGDELVEYIDQFDRAAVKKICLVHGEDKRIEALKADLEKSGFRNIGIPVRGEKTEL
jgi:metallo-beta-lactamase family protein